MPASFDAHCAATLDYGWDCACLAAEFAAELQRQRDGADFTSVNNVLMNKAPAACLIPEKFTEAEREECSTGPAAGTRPDFCDCYAEKALSFMQESYSIAGKLEQQYAATFSMHDGMKVHGFAIFPLGQSLFHLPLACPKRAPTVSDRQ